MKKAICPKCNHNFDYKRNMKNSIGGITSFFNLIEKRRNKNIANDVDSNLITVCPKCGHSFKADGYRFFGLLDISVIKIFIFLIPIAFIAISLYIILRDLFF
jgi:hypothetical protein